LLIKIKFNVKYLDKYYDDVRRQEIEELQKVFDVYELGKL
jgi:hypothetical protein